MKRAWWILKGIFFFLFFGALFSLLVMTLWNHLIPDLFGGPAITFLQALGLLVLARLLVGGFGRGGWHGHHNWRGHYARRKWGHRLKERWSKMTPEERDQFKQRMASWCGRGPWPMPEEEETAKEGTQP